MPQGISGTLRNHSAIVDRGVSQSNIDMIEYCGIDFKKWLKGFENVQASVRATVQTIVHHPLIPKDVSVSGFVIDPETGRLDAVDCQG